MLLGVFAVYDSAISTWMAPIYMRNKGEALRWWQEICNNPESKVAKHPGDFTLFELGTWEDDKCHFDLLKAPVKLGVAIEFTKTIDPNAGKVMKEDRFADYSGAPTK